MFDPLASSPFAEDNFNPPWPTTPHANSPIPNLRRSPNPRSGSPDQSSSSEHPQGTSSSLSPPPTAGLYGKEPQIYGQPEQGLISPTTNVATNGAKFEKPEPYLRVRITMLDRNRRDILIKFDAQTNLPNFTGTTYRNVSRSYAEFQQLYESIVYTNPQTIVPALPLAQTSAPTDEEDDRLVKIMLQRWFTRVCEDQFLMRDEEMRSFIESDFGYQPTPRNARRKTGSGFSLLRRGVPDEDETLQKARFELTKLEAQFFDAAKAVDKLSRVRKALSVAEAELGNKLVNVASTETHVPLGNALRKIGRTWHSISDLDQAESISECVIIGDTLGYQGMNAKSAKETLQQRTAALEEYQAAVKATISKRRHIERLKASSSIRHDKVDEALEDMEEADKYEQILAQRVNGISQNLHVALDRHGKLVNDDVNAALIEHARSVIMYERQRLRELEALRTDIANADKKYVPVTNTAPRPAYIPKLDEDASPRPPPVPKPQAAAGPPLGPPLVNSIPPSHSSSPSSVHTPQTSLPRSTGPVGAGIGGGGVALPSKLMSSHSLPPQSPGAGPSTTPSPSASTFSRRDSIPARPSSAAATLPGSSGGPPLGGRLVDGTRSMFISHSSAMSASTSSLVSPRTSVSGGAPQSPLAPSAPQSPASSVAASTPTTRDPLGPLGASSPTASSTHYTRTAPTTPTYGPSGSSVQSPLARSSFTAATDPLSGLPTTSNGVVASSGSNGHAAPHRAASPTTGGIDPLGGGQAKYMSQSMRLPNTPARPRLDPREAASKLANMF